VRKIRRAPSIGIDPASIQAAHLVPETHLFRFDKAQAGICDLQIFGVW
jgi:hypothetical protein